MLTFVDVAGDDDALGLSAKLLRGRRALRCQSDGALRRRGGVGGTRSGGTNDVRAAIDTAPRRYCWPSRTPNLARHGRLREVQRPPKRSRRDVREGRHAGRGASPLARRREVEFGTEASRVSPGPSDSSRMASARVWSHPISSTIGARIASDSAGRLLHAPSGRFPASRQVGTAPAARRGSWPGDSPQRSCRDSVRDRGRVFTPTAGGRAPDVVQRREPAVQLLEALADGRIPDFPEQCVGKDGL